ncbi:MAG: glucose-6-phosphate dehydrogenase [Lentisphaeria bacterium]|nr:glucose-6-phosphate dehydrogenase [Lentisphaeria bacterium]
MNVGNGKGSISWQELFCREQKASECEIIIFGASGDLAGRKLFPALYCLHECGLLHKNTRITGCGRHSFTLETFRDHISGTLFNAHPSTAQEQEFLQKISYTVLDYTKEEDFARLADELVTEDKKYKPFLFYLALPSPLYIPAVENLYKTGLLSEKYGKRRVIFEKPFGFDLQSAVSMNRSLKDLLTEEQIYRIDHYLGKETVQNIFLLRFANRIFEPLWNRDHIAAIQITAAETLGVEKRAGYFDQAGIVRDMFQNHLLEMLSLVTMESPEIFSADAVRDEKLKLIRAIRKIAPADAVRAQYEHYTEEEGVSPFSRTETFAALRLFIDNARWQTVPVYLRAGKCLGVKKTEIDIIFKEVDKSIFPGINKEDLQRNILHLSVQPREGIGLTLEAKMPGPKLCMGALTLSFDYASLPQSGTETLDAYARLLLDCQNGDQTLFIRSDIIEHSWQLYQGLLDHWAEDRKSIIPQYKQYSEGPQEAKDLLKRDNAVWIDSLYRK